MTKQTLQRHSPSAPTPSHAPSAFAPRGFGDALSRLPAPTPQAKLTVNQPGDKYEQEADSVADSVLRMGDTDAVQREGAEEDEEEKVQMKPLAGAISPLVQREEKDDEEEEGPVQAKALPGASPLVQREGEDDEEEDKVQAQRKETGDGLASADVSGVVSQGLSGGGQPLDDSTRAYMEPRFGHDFSQVRIHTDSRASQSSEQIAARAYTVGSDIAFRSGEFSPGSSEGKRLLAHELTHVVQQGATTGKVQRFPCSEHRVARAADGDDMGASNFLSQMNGGQMEEGEEITEQGESCQGHVSLVLREKAATSDAPSMPSAPPSGAAPPAAGRALCPSATVIQNSPTAANYPLHGKTLAQVSKNMPNPAGLTSYSYHISKVKGNPIACLNIDVSQSMKLPEWAERDTQCPPVQQEWDNFLSALTNHENGHVTRNIQQFTNAHLRFIGQPASQLKSLSNALKADVDAENQKYDSTTQHGVTQTPPTIIHTSITCTTTGASPAPSGGASGVPDATSDSSIASATDMVMAKHSDGARNHSLSASWSNHAFSLPLRHSDNPPVQRAERTTGQTLRVALPAHSTLLPMAPDIQRACAGPGHCDCPDCRETYEGMAARSAEAIPASAHIIREGAARRQVMRDGDNNPNSDDAQKELIRKAVDVTKTPGAVHEINKFRLTLATDEQRFKMLDILLNHNSFVGPIDASYIEAIWNSFGERLAPMLDNPTNFQLWKQCDSHTLVNLNSISELTALKEQFKSDILTKVRGYLSQNRDWANAEIKRLGLDNLSAPATADQTKERQEMQEVAKRLQPSLDKKQQLEGIILGYKSHVGQWWEPLVPDAPITTQDPIYFRDCIEQEPAISIKDAALPTWQKVKEQHAPLVGLINKTTQQYPTLYALIKDDKMPDFENGKDEVQTRKMMSDSMHNVLTNIDKTDAELSNTGNNLLLELQPVHEQLYGESPTWSKPFAKGVAQKTTEQYKDEKFWEQLGLASLGAALFLFATVATSGAAIAMVAAGVGISAAQATQSWLDYEKMSAASQTNLSDKTALIAQSEVNSQLIDAVLATVTAFLDLYAAGQELRAAAAGGDEAAKVAAKSKVEGAQERLAGAEGKETQELEAVAAQKELKESQEIHFKDSRGEAHEFVLQDDGIGMCSNYCGLFQQKVQERLNKLPGKPSAGNDLLKSASECDKEALALKPSLDKAAQAWQQAEDAAKAAGPADRMAAKRAAMDAKKPWTTLNDNWKKLADREAGIEVQLGNLEQEEAVNAVLGTEGYTQHLGVTDMEKQKGLGITEVKGNGNSTFKDASGSALKSGETADFVGKSPDGRYKIAESKRAVPTSNGADVKKAYNQCVNTNQALLAKEAAAKGKIDFEIWVDSVSLEKLRAGGYSLDAGGGKYLVDGAGNLQYIEVGGTPVGLVIDGAPVRVLTPRSAF